eukprot:scpid82497/ scgid5715/ 
MVARDTHMSSGRAPATNSKTKPDLGGRYDRLHSFPASNRYHHVINVAIMLATLFLLLLIAAAPGEVSGETVSDGSGAEDCNCTQCIESLVNCTAGTFWNGSVCSVCPAGYFCPGGGSGNSTACPAGYFSFQEGASSPESCKACSNGTYSPLSAASQCTQCPPGSYCDVDGQTSPLVCAAGSYSNESASVSCRPCPADHFCLSVSATPAPCPPGQFSAVGTDACSICPAQYACTAADNKVSHSVAY